MTHSLSRSAFIGLGSASLAATATRGARAQALTPVRVLGNPNDDSTALYWAIRSGAFRKAGLDVRIDTGTSGAAVAAAVAGGSYDVGKSSITSILAAHEKGLDFTLLAPAGLEEGASPFVATLVLKDAPIRSGKDLENKVVGLSSLSSIGRVAVCSWVEKNGGNWRAVRFVEIPLTQAQAAVAQQRVVAAECPEPLLAAALKTGTFRGLPTYETLSPRFPLTVWFTTREWSTRHADAARAFTRVLSESASYTNAHHAETAPMMAQASKVDLAVIAAMVRVPNGTALSAAQLQPIIDASARYGMLKAPFPAHEIIDPNAAAA